MVTEQIEARVQRLEMPEGVKVTLLSKKSRGQEVHLTLTLHYGNEENLKGPEPASGFLAELMLHGTKKLNYPKPSKQHSTRKPRTRWCSNLARFAPSPITS